MPSPTDPKPPPPSTINRTGVTMETGPVKCRRCRRTFAHFMIEEIQGLKQLRIENVLIQKMEANCLQCEWTFHWNVRDQDVQKMTGLYQKLLDKIQVYNPE